MSKTSNPVGDPRPITAEKDRDYGQVDRPQEFGRFEELTRKLVNVPKDEIDEKRREED